MNSQPGIARISKLSHYSTGTIGQPGKDWTAFADSWNRLERDRYMADGGTYRLRRYSEFDYESGSGRLRLRPHVPYSQPSDINHLNGGIERHYEPMEPGPRATEAFSRALAQVDSDFLQADGRRRWKVQCFQNRILATGSEAGLPAPEGAHRDGVDYVLTLLVARQNVVGGTSQVFDQDGESLIDLELSEPGEFIVLDDNQVFHGVTPLQPADTATPGSRDVLIAMFSADAQ